MNMKGCYQLAASQVAKEWASDTDSDAADANQEWLQYSS